MDLGNFFKNNYERHLKMIGKILYKDPDTVQDVVQEAYARAVKYQRSYDESRSSVNTWFNTILFNTLRDFQRQHQSQPDIMDEDVDSHYEEDQFSNVSDHFELIEREISCVKRERNKRILRLYYVLGYSSREISQIEEKMTVTNVTTICNRFRKTLKEKYNVEI